MIRHYIAALLSLVLVWCLLPQVALAGTPVDSYTIERYTAEAASLQSTNSTTPQVAVTLSFTPPSNKDFIIIASALINNDSTSHYTEVELDIDGTGYSTSRNVPIDTAHNWVSFGTHKVLSCNASQTYTVKIEYRTSDATGTNYAKIKRASIHVLEVGSNREYAESNSENYTTSTTYQTKVTLQFTTPVGPPESQDYLILATANLRHSTSGKSTLIQLVRDEIPSTGYEHEGIEYAASGAAMRNTLTANTTYTYEIQYCADTGANTAYVKSARIAAIPMPDLGDSEFATSETENKTALDTYGAANTKTTLSISPTTRNDWLVIPMALGKQEDTKYAFYSRLYIDTTGYDEFAFSPGVKSSYRNWFQPNKVNLSGSSHDIKIQYRTSNPSGSSEAYIKNARITAIKINTAESYNDSGHTAVDNTFSSGETTAYIWSHGLDTSTNYDVAYYDAGASGGQIVGIDNDLSPGSYGNISSARDLTTDQDATAGTWHAVVFRAGSTPPQDYNAAAGTAGYVVEDSFTVEQAAIPEFPTVISAIVIAGLCAGVYFWMRKRRLQYVKA